MIKTFWFPLVEVKLCNGRQSRAIGSQYEHEAELKGWGAPLPFDAIMAVHGGRTSMVCS